MEVRRVRYFIFLRDVLLLSVTAFGGPQAHIALFIDRLVNRRGYLHEKDLIELYALCQILPGPTSTQTITAIGYKVGGAKLAYLTLFIWMLPAVTIMTAAAITINILNDLKISLEFLRFVQPIVVGIVAFSAYRIISQVVNTKEGYFLMIISMVASFYLRSPYALPILLIFGGIVTGVKYRDQDKAEKSKLTINWSNFVLWAAVFILAAVLGGISHSLPIRTFENFYRNGSLIFGGGQVLIPLLFTEFVEFKKYLTSEEFLSGYAFAQAIPGPVFSFSAYLGALIMRSWGTGGEIMGALLAAIGIFLPGTFLIFFVIRFWENLKKYRVVRASLEGINAVSAGMVLAATLFLLEPIEVVWWNYLAMLSTVLILFYTKIPMPYLILAGLALGFIL